MANIDWSWLLEDKFKVMCKEFGGKPTDGPDFHVGPGRTIVGGEWLGCEMYDDYDNFKAFAHWLNRQPHSHKAKKLRAYYEYDEGSDLFDAELEVNGDRKSLVVSNKKQITSGDSLTDYLREELDITEDEESSDWGINFDAVCDAAINIPFSDIQHTSLNVDYNDNDEAYNARAAVHIPLPKSGLTLSSVLQDASDTVEKLTEKAHDIFYRKLDEEILRVRQTRVGGR